MMRFGLFWSRIWCVFCCALLLLGGCATYPAKTLDRADDMRWQGRLAIKVFAKPVQAWSAGFVLTGNPQHGELMLTSPLGSAVAHLQWSKGIASLKTVNGEEHFDNLDALIVQALGTPVPIEALFSWLPGQPAAAPGWEVELPQADNNRLFARQVGQEPQAELKIVFE